tara:strand:+ start:6391 stop:6675 length:285 start_codon:yes stop_codon:yes gene_type:complete
MNSKTDSMGERLLKGIINYYEDEEFLKADGFDDAVIGVDESTLRLIYSTTKCVEILIERDDMEFDEALEYFDFNVRGAYMGEKTPIWCEDMLYE